MQATFKFMQKCDGMSRQDLYSSSFKSKRILIHVISIWSEPDNRREALENFMTSFHSMKILNYYKSIRMSYK